MRGNAKSGGGTKTDFLCIMIANLRRDLHTGHGNKPWPFLFREFGDMVELVICCFNVKKMGPSGSI